MQKSADDIYNYSPENAEMGNLENQEVSTSIQDRYASLCNILRGYEEFILNNEGIIISSNLEAVNITGYEEWEIIGKHFSIFYTTEEKALGRPEEDLKAVAESGKIIYSGWRVKKKGVSFWAKIRISPLRDEQHLKGYRMVIKDTTHNALYNFRVKRVRDEYLNLFNNTFIGIFKFRLDDFKILLLNDKATTLLQKKDSDDLTFGDLFSDQALFTRFNEKLITDGTIENFEIETPLNGTWLSISCRCFAEHGFAEGILVDISEKKKQVSELQRLNQEIDKFIYHSSHDLRSPLTTILGLTHLIELDNPSAATREYNGMIQTQIQHLDNLLKSLVNITFNNTEPHCEYIDLEKEINAILRDFRHEYQNVKVSTIIRGDAAFSSDPSRIHIILKNLISNAFRFQDPHSENPVIRIMIHRQKEQLTIDVQDNGIGIDEQCLANIFSMFYKAERGSTGLGLYIVKSMVEKLHGTISVQSTRWKGSSFTITLPNVS